MRRLLVTGGAGFIGANFVRHWLHAQPRDRVVVLDALTYAGNRANLAPVEARRALPLRARRHLRRAPLVEALLRDGQASIRSCTSPPRSHVDRSIHGPGRLHPTPTSLGTHALLEAAAHVWLKERARAGHRFHHVSTDEVYGSLRPDDAPFTETHALRAELALLGEQGRGRPPGARLPPHLRAAHHDQQLLEQLRAAASFPRS